MFSLFFRVYNLLNMLMYYCKEKVWNLYYLNTAISNFKVCSVSWYIAQESSLWAL